MTKKPRKAKKTQTKQGTNWLLIGGMAAAGIIGLFALLYIALREPNTQSLAEYCAASGNCVAYGDETAPVTFVEVADFGCPHCRDFHQNKADIIKEQYVDEGKMRWVFMPYALRPDTVPAANAALCANDQGMYYEFADALFGQASIEESLTRDGFLQAGEDIGLDIDSFRTCLEDGRHNGTINTNQAAARSANVNGTPTFFVNDQIMRGNPPLEEFERRFNAILNSL